jgi:putative transposase
MLNKPFSGRDDHLRRLDRIFYQGHAWVHWTLCTEHRQTGWLSPVFHGRFRELLTHASFRYALVCPAYCLMPDHIHLLWMGLSPGSDQLNAAKYLRKHVGPILDELGFSLQHQYYDHVLRDDERLESAFVNIAEYIMRNPERKGLVPTGGYADYEFTICLVPGYPELGPFQSEYWPRFWRTHSFLLSNGLIRLRDEKSPSD